LYKSNYRGGEVMSFSGALPQEENRKPTYKMLNYIKSLIEQCGYDEDDYKLIELSYEEASILIDQLKDDLAGKPDSNWRRD
jgi:hypothetical protein